MEQENIQTVDLTKVRSDELHRTKEIIAMGRKHNLETEADKAVNEGATVEAFRAVVLGEIEKRAATSPKISAPELSRGEQKRYSLLNAINAAASQDWKNAGFERELSDECAKRNGKAAQGFYVPFSVFGERAMTAGTQNAGGYTVATDLLSGDFIDILRNKMVCLQMGARLMSGLQGNVAIPKLTTGATGYWVAENNAPTVSNPVLAQVTMTPKTLGTYVDFSRRLMLQSSLSVEQLVRDMLTNDIAVAFDDAALEGPGTGNAPTGIAATSGIGLVAWGGADTPTYAKFVDIETEVYKDNAQSANMFYVFNSTWQGKCKQAVRVSSTDSRMIMENGEINGYKCMVTEQMTNSTVIFGNFADLLMGVWGAGLDLLTDPYTGSSAGTVRVRALIDCDVAVRRAQSFCKATNSGS